MSNGSVPIALFVEGSLGVPHPRRADPFLEIWQQLLPEALGLHPIDSVVPISKVNLLMMDPDIPPRSGLAEPLDRLIHRQIEEGRCGVAVVLWDVVPSWYPAADICRRRETLALYRGLARSTLLPTDWVARAARRAAELQARPAAGARPGIPRLGQGEILAVCIEPMFEGVLLLCESVIRAALGGAGQRLRDWPTWDATSRRPDQEVLQPAIHAARKLKPKPTIFNRIRGDMETAKNDWGAHFLRAVLADPDCAALFRATPFARRLIELLAGTRRIGT